jgi:hypothetical protein
MQVGKNLILKQRAKPYVNADLFENYVRTVFLPHLAIARIMQNIRNEEAVLLMDNCSPHLTTVVIDLLSEVRVWIVTFAPNATQLFEALDLTLVGVLKRRGQYQLPFVNDAASARFIKKGYRDFRLTMTDINISRAFQGIELIHDIVEGIQCVSFDEIILRERSGFREFWDMITISLWRICRSGAKTRGSNESIGLDKVVHHLNLSVLPADTRDIFA